MPPGRPPRALRAPSPRREAALGWRILLALAAAVALPAAAGAGVPRSDRQAWGEADLGIRLAPDLRATLIGLARFGADLPEPTVAGVGAAIDLDMAPVVLGAGAYGVAARGPVDGARTELRIPFANATLGAAFARWNLSDRLRVLQLDGAPGDPVFFANRLAVDAPLARAGWITHAFVADEVFFDDALGRWYRNRAQAGVGAALGAGEDLQLYWLRQDDRAGAPRVLNVLGLTWKTALD